MVTQASESEVLREIANRDRQQADHHQQLVGRFNECPDWQAACHLLANALSNSLIQGRDRSCAIQAPPAWLPPML